MRHSRVIRKLAHSPFGNFDLLRPPKIRKNGSPAIFTPPTPVPSHIRRPAYVAPNFFSRQTGDEPLVAVVEDELEGYHGEGGVGDSRIGMIALRGDEESTVRYAGGLVAHVLDQVKDLVKVSYM